MDNVEPIRAAYDSFAHGGDVDAVMAILADDVEWHAPQPLPQAIDAHGKEQVGQFFARLTDKWEDWVLEVETYVASGDRVCVIGSASGRIHGKHRRYGFVHVWTLRDGMCVRFDEYVDPDPELIAI